MRAPWMHRLADAAAADDGDRRARAHLRGVERRADAGGDAAADERELLVGRSVSIFTTDDSSTVIASAKVPSPVIVVYVACRRGGCRGIAIMTSNSALAQVRLVVQAEAADAARGDEGGDDAVALLHPGDLRADLDDRAGALVAEDHVPGIIGDVAVLHR